MSRNNDEKKQFIKKVTIIVDTREQKNSHIIAALDSMGIANESRKLDYGDYSFMIEGHDFSCSCVIERKANVNEVYGNITADRERIEKELDTIAKNATQCTFLLENCAGWESLKDASLSAAEMKNNSRKVSNIGATVYSTLQAWRCANRYNFTVEFVEDNAKSALKMLETFFWYWHNYKKSTAPRK